MKLTSAQVERTLTQFQGEAIPDNHPVIPQLNSLFGEHTFFLDSNGLNIVEPAEAATSLAARAVALRGAVFHNAHLANQLPCANAKCVRVIAFLSFGNSYRTRRG